MNVLDYSIRLGKLLRKTEEGRELFQLEMGIEEKYKDKDNSFQSVRFSTDYGYATSLNLRVYLWEDEIEGQEPVMVVEYKPVEWGMDYDIVHDPEKFQMYVDGELMKNP